MKKIFLVTLIATGAAVIVLKTKKLDKSMVKLVPIWTNKLVIASCMKK